MIAEVCDAFLQVPRVLLGDISPDRATGLLVTEAWVSEPDDEHRQAALEIGSKGDANDPLSWLALAAGWAGGCFVLNAKKQVPVPQYMTPRAARVAILISALKVSKDQRLARLQTCVAEGMKLAESGPPQESGH